MFEFLFWYLVIGAFLSVAFVAASNQARIPIPSGGPILVVFLWPAAVTVVTISAIKKVLER